MEYIKVILPSLCVGLLFWYILRAIIKADGNERKAMDKYYAELDDANSTPSVESGRVEPSDTQKEGAHGKRNEVGPY